MQGKNLFSFFAPSRRCGIFLLHILVMSAPLTRAQTNSLLGTWSFVSDSDGSVIDPGSAIQIAFNNAGGVSLTATGGNLNIADSGTYRVSGNLISFSLPGVGKAVSNKPFTLGANQLVLPFKVLSDGAGSSTWKKRSNLGDLKSGGSGGKTGSAGQSGPSGPGGPGGPPGPGGSGGRGGSGGSGTGATGRQPASGELAGTWVGRGSGEEVRYRHPNSVLILTVKHNTEFFFHVDEKGQISGEGSIEYNLERNTEGLDQLAASVSKAMSMIPWPAPPGTAPIATVLDPGIKETVTNTPGVTKLQYDAPHLKYGKEIRHFKFSGKVETKNPLDKNSEPLRLFLNQEGDFTRPDGTPDQQLIAAWEVNRVKEEKNFPCWSPFLDGSATLRRGPGGIWIAEFQEKGTHRNGVKVWQEYGYVWMARQNK